MYEKMFISLPSFLPLFVGTEFNKSLCPVIFGGFCGCEVKTPLILKQDG